MKKLDINKLTFGSDDAELDEKRGFLDKVFLKTSIFERAKRSERELVIGRKGSGKSAICLMLKKAFEADGMITLRITPESFSKQRLEQLKISSMNEQQTYTLGWKYVLLTSIGLKILEVSSQYRMSSKSKKYINNIRVFLSENGETELSFTQKVREASKFLSKFSIKAYGIEGSVEAKQLQKQIYLANSLQEFQNNIDMALSQLRGAKINVLIDQVDDIWIPTKESEMLVIGLIKGVHELNSEIQQSHFFLFLRSDIYDSLKFENADKLRSLEERIEWKDSDLKHLIVTRGKVSTGIDSSSPDELWKSIFEETINGENSFSYIYKRTLKRPRELIQFCNIAVAEAQDNNHEYITARDVLLAEKQYSNWKYRDLANEYDSQYPYLEDILSSFQGFLSEFSFNQFANRFDETKIRLSNPEVNSISNEKMLQILFIIGFLGTKIDGEDVFSYQDSSYILAQQHVIVVHPAYQPALGLSKTKNSPSRDEPSSKPTDINVAGDIVAGNKIVQTHYDPIISSSRELETLERHKENVLEDLTNLNKLAEAYELGKVPANLQSSIASLNETLVNLERKISFIETYLRSQKNSNYRSVATSKTPALIIYLLDVSGSMSEAYGSSTRIDLVSKALHKVAVKMVQRSTKGAIVSPRYRIAMFAYSSQVIDLLGGIKTIDEVAKMGIPRLTTLDATDTAGAFMAAENLLITELPNIQDHPAPLICHMTDGEYNGTDPRPIAERIMNMAVPDGNVLIENIYFKSDTGITVGRDWAGVTSPWELSDQYSQKLLEMSSIIPDSYRSVMREFGYKLDMGVRMFFPAESVELLELAFAMSGATPLTAS